MRLVLAAALAIATPAAASDFRSMQLATELGNMLGSEEACGLSYDQAAIERFIEGKVAADDMSFPSTLNMMAEGARFNLEGMSASAKTAHCTQIRRAARSHGFIGE